MKKHLNLLLASTFLISALAACSSEEPSSSDSSSGSSGGTTSSSSSSTSTTTSDSGGVIGGGAVKENTNRISAEDSNAIATITSAGEGKLNLYNGVVDVPDSEARFVAQDLSYLDHLIALGITPYAANIPNAPTEESTPAQVVSWQDGFGRIYADYDLSGVEVVANTLDIESLLLLKPDYLMVSDSLVESLSQMEQVAPVYMIDSTLGYDSDSYSCWQETHRVIGAITGHEEEAEQVIADYYDLLDGYIEELGGSMAGKSAMIFQLDTKGIQYAAMETHPHIYKDLQFDAPNNVPVGSRETIAVENLVDINPDYIFMTVESYEDLAVLEASPIWQNLEAVKNGNVFEFAHYGWNRTKGPLGATLKLTEVCEFLLHGTQTSARFNLN